MVIASAFDVFCNDLANLLTTSNFLIIFTTLENESVCISENTVAMNCWLGTKEAVLKWHHAFPADRASE